jgi:hypothetical protein
LVRTCLSRDHRTMSHAVDETYDVYTEKLRCAVKNHKCSACGETILKGTHYFSVHWVFDGTAQTIKRCARCQAIHLHLRTLSPGDMWPDEELNCGEEYREHWGKDPPKEIAELAFLRPEEVPLPLHECASMLPRKIYDYVPVGGGLMEWVPRECTGNLLHYTPNWGDRPRSRLCNYSERVTTCHGCNHHPDGTVTFSPAGKVSHQRCYGCNMVRYARADGSWWPWQRETSTEKGDG